MPRRPTPPTLPAFREAPILSRHHFESSGLAAHVCTFEFFRHQRDGRNDAPRLARTGMRVHKLEEPPVPQNAPELGHVRVAGDPTGVRNHGAIPVSENLYRIQRTKQAQCVTCPDSVDGKAILSDGLTTSGKAARRRRRWHRAPVSQPENQVVRLPVVTFRAERPRSRSFPARR